MKLIHANILTAFQPSTVGTRVTQPEALTALLLPAIEACDFDSQDVIGQAVIALPDAARQMVLAGVGPASENPEHYIPRYWRGRVGLYLRREFAAQVNGVAAVVYTRDAYMNDPQMEPPEMARMEAEKDATHVLVAILAFAGPRAPLTPYRFVANLAGGNLAALQWSADKIRSMAKDIIAYDDAWSVVAD